MSRKSKGDRRERQCVNLLEDAGWKAHRKVNNAYDSGDIFGLFDLVAVKHGEKPAFIQVKSNSTGGALKHISEAHFVDPSHVSALVFIAHDRQGWRVKQLTQTGWSQIMDERKRDCNYGEATVELFSQKSL
jgi:Holliday junction resolvase